MTLTFDSVTCDFKTEPNVTAPPKHARQVSHAPRRSLCDRMDGAAGCRHDHPPSFAPLYSMRKSHRTIQLGDIRFHPLPCAVIASLPSYPELVDNRSPQPESFLRVYGFTKEASVYTASHDKRFEIHESEDVAAHLRLS